MRKWWRDADDGNDDDHCDHGDQDDGDHDDGHDDDIYYGCKKIHWQETPNSVGGRKSV